MPCRRPAATRSIPRLRLFCRSALIICRICSSNNWVTRRSLHPDDPPGQTRIDITSVLGDDDCVKETKGADSRHVEVRFERESNPRLQDHVRVETQVHLQFAGARLITGNTPPTTGTGARLVPMLRQDG